MRTQLDSLRDWSNQLVSLVGHSDVLLDHAIDDFTADWNELNTRCQAEMSAVDDAFSRANIFLDRLTVGWLSAHAHTHSRLLFQKFSTAVQLYF